MKHQDRSHAPLSPSAASRWMACPGSYAACQGIESKPSDAALEGTKAHEWAERLMNAENSEEYDGMLATLQKQDEEMAFHVDNYIDFLNDLKAKFQTKKFTEYEEYIEARVKFTDSIWGTLDYGLARRKKKGKWQALISDFKYGRGTYVPIENNKQLIVYTLSLERFIGVRFEKAWISVYQPRFPKDQPYEISEISGDELDVWREVIQQAEKNCLAIARGTVKPQYAAGDHCQFCPAQPQCPTFRKHVQVDSLKILDEKPLFPAIERTPIETLVKLHKAKKQIEHYLENVDHFLLMRGLAKQNIGDLKIVEGRSNRRWLDDVDEVAKGLQKLGANPYVKKLITIGSAEKYIGKNKIDHLTTKGPGKLQLALPEDTRPLAELGKDSIDLLDDIKQ